MKKITLAEMTIDQLVDRFAEIGIAQDQALLGGATREFTQLFNQMRAVDEELRARGNQARLALLQLYVIRTYRFACRRQDGRLESRRLRRER